MKTAVITHRGLEPSRADSFLESSLEAFQDHLSRGFGIEFDPTFLADGKIAVFHDRTLQRISNGKDSREITAITYEELKAKTLTSGTIPLLEQILHLIESRAQCMCALHLKGIYQSEPYLDLFLSCIDQHKAAFKNCIIFDLKPEIAKQVHSHFPEINLAASVAHPYDIERYNACVFGTLLSLEELIANGNLYAWAWLDEWDLSDRDRKTKALYTPQVFTALRQNNFKIGLVTPELHATSPGLYGGESHPDAKNFTSLMQRIKTILDLHPDAVCTDYPEETKKLLSGNHV